MDKSKIGLMVYNARRRNKLSQEELAEQAGTGQSTIDRIEKGKFKRMPSVLPSIFKVLGLQLADIDASFAAGATATPASGQLVGERNLPVYAAAEAGRGALVLSSDPVDYVRRPAPLAQVKDGYAIIVVGESMVPAYEPGDSLLVHPHLPPVPGVDVVLYSEIDGEVLVTIKRLRRITETHWHLTQWNPPDGGKQEFTLARKDWQKCHRVVGKYSRR